MRKCSFVLIDDQYICSACGKCYPARLGGDYISNCNPEWKKRNPKRRIAVMDVVAKNPGHHLHSLIKRFLGQDYRANCHCENMVVQMNAWGPAGCREHLEEIVDKMMAEGTKRGWKLKIASRLPLARSVARRMVLLAIKRAEKEQPLSNP